MLQHLWSLMGFLLSSTRVQVKGWKTDNYNLFELLGWGEGGL